MIKMKEIFSPQNPAFFENPCFLKKQGFGKNARVFAPKKRGKNAREKSMDPKKQGLEGQGFCAFFKLHFSYRLNFFTGAVSFCRRAPLTDLGHPQNGAFSLRAFEMGGSGRSGRDPFCTPTDVECM